MTARVTGYRCLFCGAVFDRERGAIWLALRFCPKCLDLWAAAALSVAHWADAIAVERPQDMPHCAVIPSGLPRKGGVAT